MPRVRHSMSLRSPPETLSATLHTVAITVERLRQRGLSPAAVLAHSGVSPSLIREPTQLITRAKELSVFANAWRLTGDGGIGLDIGAAMHLPSYGLLGYAMMVNPTLAQALRCGLSYPLLLGSYFRLTLQVRGSEAVIVASDYHYRADLEVLNTDMCLASLWAIVCDVLGRRTPPSALRLSYPAPAHAAHYAQVLGCEPEFDAGENALVFPGEWLDQTLQFAEPISCQMAMQQCQQLEREWSQASGDGVIARVLRLLNTDPQRYRHLDDVAEVLCLSGRTLRRRLLAADTHFQALRDQALHEKALEYLQRTDMPLAEVAERLGYSEPASFRQAFRRWTGDSPTAHRRRRSDGFSAGQR